MSFLTAAILMATVPAGDAHSTDAHSTEAHAHEAHPLGGEGQHGNPGDMAGYVARMEEPGRAEWQKPDQVVAALHLKAGQVACDIGAGPGYFALRLAQAVGETGRVFAVDVEPQMLEALRERLPASHARNITPVLALPGDALLPSAACDLILIVDTYHHFPDGPAYLRQLSRSLRAGGRIVNIDFHKRELPLGPAVAHKVSREAFLTDAEAAGLKLVAEEQFLPYQYFVTLAAR